MKYTIYKTTNLVNDKIYIGQHICSCKQCSYMGSGNAVKKAFKKHGLENFKKEILFEFDTFKEMNEKEAEIVTRNFIEEDSNYNLVTGGKAQGIPCMKTREKLSIAKMNRHVDEKTREKLSIAAKNRSAETCKKISLSNRGKKRSADIREKMSAAQKGKCMPPEAGAKISASRKEKHREKLGNKDILQIDPKTNEIVGRYRYVSDIEFPSCKVMIGIKKSSIRYGYIWRLE